MSIRVKKLLISTRESDTYLEKLNQKPEKQIFGSIVFSVCMLDKKLKQISAVGFSGIDLFTHDITEAEIISIKKTLHCYHIEIALYIPFFLSEKNLCSASIDKDRRNISINAYLS